MRGMLVAEALENALVQLLAPRLVEGIVQPSVRVRQQPLPMLLGTLERQFDLDRRSLDHPQSRGRSEIGPTLHGYGVARWKLRSSSILVDDPCVCLPPAVGALR